MTTKFDGHRRAVIRNGLELQLEETERTVEIFTPFFSDVAPVVVYKPQAGGSLSGRPSAVNWVSCGSTEPQQANEMAVALQYGADLGEQMNRASGFSQH